MKVFIYLNKLLYNVIMKNKTQVSYVEKITDKDQIKIIQSHKGESFAEYRKKYDSSLKYDDDYKILNYPLTVTLEMINRCNLKCIMCYTDHHKKVKSTLQIEQLDKFLEECKKFNVPAIIIGLGSEVLMYKGIRDVVKKVMNTGFMDVMFSTNATLLNDEMSKFLIESNVTRVVISLDAANDKTYKTIRSKDELKKVDANVKRLAELKKEYNTQLPIIRLSFVVQKENINEIQQFKEKWSDIVDYIDIQEEINFEPVKEVEKWDTEKNFELGEKISEDTNCSYPFNSLHLYADGEIRPCCNFYGLGLPLGNIDNISLEEAWNGEKIKKIREGLLKNKPNRVCRECLSQRGKGYNWSDIVKKSKN
jgi:radical SAM protein with 4Fe4S-binding SPASM domain